jgi:hypothetical protein
MRKKVSIGDFMVFPSMGMEKGKVTIHTHHPLMGKQNGTHLCDNKMEKAFSSMGIVICRRIISLHFPMTGD